MLAKNRWHSTTAIARMLWAISLLGLCIPAAFSVTHASSSIDIYAALASAADNDPHLPQWSTYRSMVENFYRRNRYQPVWLGATLDRQLLSQALAELRNAQRHGLRAQDYDTDWLAEQADKIDATELSPSFIDLDIALTLEMLRYLSDLHYGRVNPRGFAFLYDTDTNEFDAVAALRNAIDHNQFAAVAEAAQPTLSIYRRLEKLLPAYRALARQDWPTLTIQPPKRSKIEPGDTYASVDLLRERLQDLGDYDSGEARTDTPEERSAHTYAGALVKAVKRFQTRHGLLADGILGQRTLDALNVPPAQRVQQIEMSLERLRWLPTLPAGPLIAINIPSYRLLAFSAQPSNGRAELEMPVIVGRAVHTPTPIFIGEMRYIEFNPYWNVPSSILHKEILPKLAHDPTYLQREDMEMVATDSNDPHPITAVNRETLALLRAGKLRIRQRPGQKNALDGIKFGLPNNMDIYLHGTPAHALFERTRRDFSHGCIRVAHPLELARFVLHDRPEWDAQHIEAAIASGQTSTVQLHTPVPVVIFYTTAIADRQGHALFLPDIYGLDANLAQALHERRQ